MFNDLTPEYIQCIKTLLINRCLVEYEAAKYDTNTVEDFCGILIESIQDTETWAAIFEKTSIRTLFRYYMAIQSGHKDQSTASIPVFHIPTFQEYIDNLVRFETFGPTDYQRFTASMSEPTFRKNMIDKYHQDIQESHIKNHIIYIVQLYLLERTGYSKHFTDTEKEYLDVAINIIPLFEYIGRKNWTLEDLDTIEPDYDKIQDITNSKLELDTLRQIKEYL